MNFFSGWFITIICLLEKSFGKILLDQINTNINWIYLTKFSFHPIDGFIDIRLEYSRSIENVIKFVVLSKEEWKNDLLKICSKKELILHEDNNQTNFWTLSTSFTDANRMYLILSLCNSSVDGYHAIYKVILTNGKNLFTEHFSNDERGILELAFVSTSLYTILFLIILRSIHISKNKSCLIIRFYLISIFFSWFNSLISLILTLIFAFTGSDQTILYRFLVFFARFFDYFAQILFLLTLILCAKGYLIIRLQLKKKTMFKIRLFISLYIIMQIILLILITISVNEMIPNEKFLLICNCIQMVMYLLSCFWFVSSLLFTRESLKKEFYFFLIFLIWFLTNAIVILLNILDILPTPQETILRSIQIAVQLLAYSIFRLITRSERFFLRTQLNQVNITYIDPAVSKSSIKESTTNDREIESKSNELMNLCFVENTWTARFRTPMDSSGLPSRLEPRRDVLSTTLTKSSVNTNQPSICHVPRRLPSLNHDDQ